MEQFEKVEPFFCNSSTVKPFSIKSKKMAPLFNKETYFDSTLEPFLQ